MKAGNEMAGDWRTVRLLLFLTGLCSVLSQGMSYLETSFLEELESKHKLVEAMFVFGDSVLDAGTNNYFPSLLKANFKPYGQPAFSKPTGRFTNGKTYADFFAEKLHLKSPEPYLARTGELSVNYASGGSGVFRSTNAANQVIPYPDQLLQFEQTKLTLVNAVKSSKAVELILSKSLFLISIGGNDLVTNFLDPSPDRPPSDVFITKLVAGIEESVKTLYQAGGRKFLLFAQGPLGCIPAVLAAYQVPDGKCFQPLSDLTEAFNVALEELVLRKLPETLKDIKAIVAKPFEIVGGLLENGEAEGFTEGLKACCGYGLYNGEVQCGLVPDKILNPPYNLCDNVDAYLFWDYFHPTERVYSILAENFWKGDSSVIAPMNLKTLVRSVPPEDCGSQHRGEEQAVDPAAVRTITDRRQKERSCGDSGHENEDCPEFISLFREITSGSMQEWMIPDAVGDMDDLDALK
ncbi:hypothetical protein R1sor_007797 [Riccia sorocarpa]|uniref:GDSL esterase/lipase n=1 Tax=Riccia sorocarpa TaxID=122646 RepID=A0ABD3HTN4_9MARC